MAERSVDVAQSDAQLKQFTRDQLMQRVTQLGSSPMRLIDLDGRVISTDTLFPAVPVLVDLGRGTTPGPLAATGMVIGLVALVLTSWTPGGQGSVRAGAVLGVSSGVAFENDLSSNATTTNYEGILANNAAFVRQELEKFRIEAETHFRKGILGL